MPGWAGVGFLSLKPLTAWYKDCAIVCDCSNGNDLHSMLVHVSVEWILLFGIGNLSIYIVWTQFNALLDSVQMQSGI